MLYRTVIDASELDDQQPQDILYVLDSCRELGSAELDWNIPGIVVEWEVGPRDEDAISDLYELADVVDDLTARLGGFLTNYHIEQPHPVPSAASLRISEAASDETRPLVVIEDEDNIGYVLNPAAKWTF